MYKLKLNEQNQIIGYNKVKEAQDGDIIFTEQDIDLVEQYMQFPHQQERKELQDIERWLNANDYKINKHTLGEYTDDDERWTSYLQDRQVKLARYNELELIIASGLLPAFDVSLLTPIPEPEPIVEEVVEEVVEPTETELLEEIIEDETA